MNVFEWNDHFRIMPAFAWQNAFNSLEVLGGKKVPEDFSLSSDTNPMLEHSIEEIRRLLQKK